MVFVWEHCSPNPTLCKSVSTHAQATQYCTNPSQVNQPVNPTVTVSISKKLTIHYCDVAVIVPSQTTPKKLASISSAFFKKSALSSSSPLQAVVKSTASLSLVPSTVVKPSAARDPRTSLVMMHWGNLPLKYLSLIILQLPSPIPDQQMCLWDRFLIFLLTRVINTLVIWYSLITMHTRKLSSIFRRKHMLLHPLW